MTTPALTAQQGWTAVWAGASLSLALGLVATGLGRLAPVIGAPVFGLVLGMLVRQWLGQRDRLAPGIRFSSKTVLQAAIVLLGAGLSLAQIARVGWSTLPILLSTVVLALIAGSVIGRALGIGFETRTLITVGTGICGASAIAAVSAVINASATSIAVAVTVIFVYNALAALAFPALGHLLGMSQEAFGVWAGTAINDTSSVVAAGTVYGAVATSQAIIVKLTRTLMIIPISMGYAWRDSRVSRARGGRSDARWFRLVPPFLLLFLLAALLNTLGLVPADWQGGIKAVAVFLTAVALSAIGLSTPVAAMRQAGWRPLALGASLWAFVAASALLLQLATGGL